MTEPASADDKAVLLEQIRRQVWTGHNIPLSSTESTLGSEKELIGDDARTITIKKLIGRFVARKPARVADLGSLEGGVSFELAREGHEVTGIEGRPSNFEKAELIRRYAGLPNLRFELRDVKTLGEHGGTFDAVVCCGLLYHLDNPFSFLRTLRKVTGPEGLLFIDTHVAPDDPSAHGGTYAAALSPIATLDGYEGRWFAEPSGGSVLDQQWSAVSNERSFWPTRRALIRAIHHAGFPTILEIFGRFPIDGEFELRDRFSRVWLAAVADL
ncbi:MAG TPA: class I SAM-dependent methyltransferase [Thermoanaerobaculia bacterium]